MAASISISEKKIKASMAKAAQRTGESCNRSGSERKYQA